MQDPTVETRAGPNRVLPQDPARVLPQDPARVLPQIPVYLLMWFSSDCVGVGGPAFGVGGPAFGVLGGTPATFRAEEEGPLLLS